MKLSTGKRSTGTVRCAAPRADRLSDSVAILLGITAVQRLVGLARGILFCAWLSAEELGEWDMAFGFLTLAVPVAVLSLPGCFGRYIAYYRERGQLRVFVRRTIGVTLLLALISALALLGCQQAFSRFIFGRTDLGGLLPSLAFTLLAVIAINVVNELLVALRLQRLASSLELLSTVLFAGISALLVTVYRLGTLGVVIGYGSGCLIAAAASLWWIVPLWHALPEAPDASQRSVAVWSKLVPFAAALWLSNALANLFSVADRYILIHYSGLGSDESLALTGEYHSSRLLPMVLVNLSVLLGTVSLPYLSHDWETGPRAKVSLRLNLFLKLAGLGLVAAATAMWFLSPLLFIWLLRGRFAAAPALLSLTLAYACLSGMVCIAKNYLWCAERATLVGVAYAAALAVNIGLNLVLAPRFGVYGIAHGTCVAHVVLLLLIYALCRANGFAVGQGTLLISSLPLLLLLGPAWTMAGLLAVSLLALVSELVFDGDEKRQIAETISRYRAKLFGWLSRWPWDVSNEAIPEENTLPRSAAATEPPAARPLRLMFVNTSLYHLLGGAERLEIELARGFDRGRILPEVCCLKAAGPVADQLPADVPVFQNLIRHKYDVTVLPRLVRLFRRRQIDIVVTLGAGDRMFWGRLAAWLAGVPAITTWLHSTGWPDKIGTLNRLLTPITDAFIAVAASHRRYLVEQERLPADRVYQVSNGVDTERFLPRPADHQLRARLGLPAAAPVGGIVARLWPEKNHELFLRVAALVRKDVGDAQFLVVGDGSRREQLRAMAEELGLAEAVHFLGTRSDVPGLLALMDVFLLTSHIEANPLSILEAQAMARPVVATRVGSVPDTVRDGEVGYLVEPGDARAMADRVVELFRDPRLARRLGGEARRQVVERHSMRRMLAQFQDLLEQLVAAKAGRPSPAPRAAPEAPVLGAVSLPKGKLKSCTS
jgi:glycosyltransferase involved in cell wall biosynthesis/O-antigen/teichoic acid export membrane protein